MLTKDEIKDYFQLENSHAKKELGQNFLVNKKIIEEIVELIDLKEEDVLLEIGPGLGSLTDDLIKKAKNYTVVEYDAKFVDFLNRSYGENKNIKIIKNNILKYKDFNANKVIGNLPYYITSDILLYVALNFSKLDKAVFMIQKEAYERITAKKGNKDYNALNIVLDYAFEIVKNMNVSRTSFFPMPQVDSVVISLKRKNVEFSFIKPLLVCTRAMFLNRRKTIFNNLNSLVKNKDKTYLILDNLGIQYNARAESLNLEDFIHLTNELLKLEIIKL